MAKFNPIGDNRFVVGIDISKSVFQVFSCDLETGEYRNEAIKRDKFLAHFENHEKCLIGMESCGTSQYWARQLKKLGHTVRLMDGKAVKAYVQGNKSDAADAKGIFDATMHGVRAVAIKNENERDLSILLTMRRRMVRNRTATINHVRGILAEYGQVMPISANRFRAMVDECINSLEGDAVQTVIDELHCAVAEILSLDERIHRLEEKLAELLKQSKHAEHFKSVPGVGLITTAYMCVFLADPSAFSSARQFSAFLGLVPKHAGTGGKNQIGHIPGRSNKYLRALMVECAQSVARRKLKSDWVISILKNKPKKVALIAIANRIARQCWAVAKKDQNWRDLSVVTTA